MEEASNTGIFDPIFIRGVEFRNRVWVPPMCQYMAPNGIPTDWHLAHYAGLASSTGAVVVEATATSDEARVTPHDLVLHTSRDLDTYVKLAATIRSRGAVPGIQLSHAGRKGSRTRPWEGDTAISMTDGGWRIIAPSPLAFGAGFATPQAMSEGDIGSVIEEFRASAALARQAGFDLIEVHAAHGRLIHSFLSAVSNRRTDGYGGSLNNRMRIGVELARALRDEIGPSAVLVFRLSCVDWCESGITIEDSVQIARALLQAGVDLIDCSSGGIVRPLEKKTAPEYQVPFARQLRREAGILTAAVGLINSLDRAEGILSRGDADVVFLGRFLMMDPLALTRHAAAQGKIDHIPMPYRRAALHEKRSDTSDFVPEL